MHVLAKHVADGDPLSYYLSLDKGGEVVVDLGCAAVIDCLEYMPRNDDNFISPGDTYELFCHAGTEGWKSLGKQRLILPVWTGLCLTMHCSGYAI